MTAVDESEVILVVDDSPDTLSLVNDALEESGYSVLVALEGKQALAISTRMRPDLVLMDACMPGMDGFETCREMKKNPALSSIPVIFMTGLGESEDVVRGLDAGGTDYLTKPVRPDELIARIRVHLKNARITNRAYRTLDTAGQFLVTVNDSGELLRASPEAGTLLAGTGKGSETLASLASALEGWIVTIPSPGDSFSFQLENRSLTATLVESPHSGEYLLRLKSLQESSRIDMLRKAFALTPRESEVLYWLSNGKTNREIAEILGMSPRTVNKHLEQVFPKLGVENRTAATRMVLSKLSDL